VPIYLVLTPLDGSLVAEQALPLAEELARLAGAQVLLLLVLDRKDQPMRFLDPAASEEARKAGEYLARLAAGLQGRGFSVHQRVLEGEPGEVIVREAQQAGAGIIVMTTHGGGGSGWYALGSVALAVLRQSLVPVAFVRTK
jgi:nucleotide-binding universal stress UspA family protein